MKKAIALLLALIMLFSTVCAGVNAVDAEPEQTDGKVETEEGRIILTDDELTEKFGIEKILLPEGFDPVAYVYYNGVYYAEKEPEYLTLVFTDGTTITEKEDKHIVRPDGKEFYFYYNEYYPAEYYGGSFYLYSSDAYLNIHFVEKSEQYDISVEYKYKKVSFLSNLKSYIKIVLLYYTYSFIRGHDPRGGGIFERDYFFPEYIEDIKRETSDFIHWYIDEI